MDTRKLEAIQGILSGRTLRAIADELGISTMLLYHWRQEPEFQRELTHQQDQVRAQVSDILVNEAVDSVNTIVALRKNSAQDKIRLDAAKDLLDRAGFSPVNKVAQVTQHSLAPETIAQIKSLLEESKRATVIEINEISQLPERPT
jgi:hypothetical protein